jgi:hypothetical protein
VARPGARAPQQANAPATRAQIREWLLKSRLLRGQRTGMDRETYADAISARNDVDRAVQARQTAVLELLSDDDPLVRREALVMSKDRVTRWFGAGAEAAVARAIPHLEELAQEKDAEVSLAAVRRLLDAGEAGRLAIYRLLASDVESTRLAAANAIESRGSRVKESPAERALLEKAAPKLFATLSREPGRGGSDETVLRALGRLSGSQVLLDGARERVQSGGKVGAEQMIRLIDLAVVTTGDGGGWEDLLFTVAGSGNPHALELQRRRTVPKKTFERGFASSDPMVLRGAALLLGDTDVVADQAMTDRLIELGLKSASDRELRESIGLALCSRGAEWLAGLAEQAVSGDEAARRRAREVLKLASEARLPSWLRGRGEGASDGRRLAAGETFRAQRQPGADLATRELQRELLVSPDESVRRELVGRQAGNTRIGPVTMRGLRAARQGQSAAVVQAQMAEGEREVERGRLVLVWTADASGAAALPKHKPVGRGIGGAWLGVWRAGARWVTVLCATVLAAGVVGFAVSRSRAAAPR